MVIHSEPNSADEPDQPNPDTATSGGRMSSPRRTGRNGGAGSGRHPLTPEELATQARAATDPEIVAALYHESRDFRRKLHSQDWGNGPCDIRLVHAACGLTVVGNCLCSDFLRDAVVECCAYVARRKVDNAAAAARVHLRKFRKEWIRHRRVARGAQARTDRLSTSGLGRALPTDYHRWMFETVVDEAGQAAPLEGQAALIRRLASRAAARFGGAVDDHLAQAEQALAQVERICRAQGQRKWVDGVLTDWWHRNIEIPMGRRPRLTDIPIDAHRVGDDTEIVPEPETATHDLDRVAVQYGLTDAADAVVDFAVVSRVLAAMTASAGGDATTRLRTVVLELAGQGLVPPQAAAEFRADPARVADALSALGDFFRD